MSDAPRGTASQTSESTSAGPIHRRLARLRRRLMRRRRVRDLRIHVPGAVRAYQVAIPDDPDGVLDELAMPEPHMPYWATPWPSGLALAEVALARREQLAGRSVLELGCGLGVTAAALVECGARATAVDCFGEALAYTRYNVARNTGRTPRTLRVDWRTAHGSRWLVDQRADIVMAADVLYESEDVEPLLALGEEILRRGAAIWLAEPGRATSRRFVDTARERAWRGEQLVVEREWPAEVGSAIVRVHLFEPH